MIVSYRTVMSQHCAWLHSCVRSGQVKSSRLCMYVCMCDSTAQLAIYLPANLSISHYRIVPYRIVSQHCAWLCSNVRSGQGKSVVSVTVQISIYLTISNNRIVLCHSTALSGQLNCVSATWPLFTISSQMHTEYHCHMCVDDTERQSFVPFPFHSFMFFVIVSLHSSIKLYILDWRATIQSPLNFISFQFNVFN